MLSGELRVLPWRRHSRRSRRARRTSSAKWILRSPAPARQKPRDSARRVLGGCEFRDQQWIKHLLRPPHCFKPLAPRAGELAGPVLSPLWHCHGPLTVEVQQADCAEVGDARDRLQHPEALPGQWRISKGRGCRPGAAGTCARPLTASLLRCAKTTTGGARGGGEGRGGRGSRPHAARTWMGRSANSRSSTTHSAQNGALIHQGAATTPSPRPLRAASRAQTSASFSLSDASLARSCERAGAGKSKWAEVWGSALTGDSAGPPRLCAWQVTALPMCRGCLLSAPQRRPPAHLLCLLGHGAVGPHHRRVHLRALQLGQRPLLLQPQVGRAQGARDGASSRAQRLQPSMRHCVGAVRKPKRSLARHNGGA